MFRYRILTAPNLATGDPGGDMTFGRGTSNFFIDNPQATAQSIRTRLGLWVGEWFLDLTKGTNWQSFVGQRNAKATADSVLQERIGGTFGVQAIVGWWSGLDGTSRIYAMGCVVQTIWGFLTVSLAGTPGGAFQLDVSPLDGGDPLE